MKNKYILVFVLAILYAIIFSWRLDFNARHVTSDWPYFYTTSQLNPPIQLPNPWYGTDHWRLENRYFNPWKPLYWMFGDTKAANLELPTHLAVAFFGGWLLADLMGLGLLGCLTCALVYPSSSFLYLHFAIGGLVFLPFAYFPLILATQFTKNSLLRIVSLTLLMVIMIMCEGASAATIQIAVILCLFNLLIKEENNSDINSNGNGNNSTNYTMGICYSKKTRYYHLFIEKGQRICCLIITGIAIILLCWPKLHIASASPRYMGTSQEHLTHLSEYLACFFSPGQTHLRYLSWSEKGFMGFWECGAYISPYLIPLILLGIFTSWVWTGIAIFTVVIGMGDFFGAYSPYCLIHWLPFISQSRISPRWFMSSVFCFGILAAIGTDRFSKENRIGFIIASTILTVSMLDMWFVSTQCLGFIQ